MNHVGSGRILSNVWRECSREDREQSEKVRPMNPGFSVPDPSQLSEKDMIHVLEGIEMRVRPSNAGSTGPSLISIYEV